MRALKILGLIVVLFVSLSTRGRAVGSQQPIFVDPNTPPCTKTSCQTTCTGPQGVECCCYYVCNSGSEWVCHEGQYCDNSSGGCVFNTWP